MSKEAMKLALEALLWANDEINGWRDDAYGYEPEDQPVIMSAITALREALAEQPAPVQNFDHTSAANAALRDAQNRSYQVAKCKYPKCSYPCTDLPDCRDAEQPAHQEPVAWITKDGEIYKHECWPEYEARPLVFGDTSPPAQRTWVGLTDEEMYRYCPNWLSQADFQALMLHIEAKLKEKNT